MFNNKSILVKGVDGGPDENPRFYNNILMAIKSFQVDLIWIWIVINLMNQELELDCLIEVTEAPGLSAFNKAERRMYFLSKELGGVVLPHDTFGSHLVNGKTVDEDLEMKNFQAAGEALADLWGNMMIDSHPVTAEYVASPPLPSTKDFSVSAFYKSRHLIQTQYMTIVLKCDDLSCCTKPKTQIMSFFPGRRLPALIPIKFSDCGPQALDLDPEIWKKQLMFPSFLARGVLESNLVPPSLKEKFGAKVPYDAFFPTLQSQVERR